MNITATAPSQRNFDEVRGAIEEFDLEPIKVKLMDPEEGLGWSRDRAEAVERLYRGFLFLSFKYQDRPLTPSWDIDDFWHFHILDTMKYAEDCDRIFGFFLHHFPYFGMRGEEDAANLVVTAEETRRLFHEEFGADLAAALAEANMGKKCGKYCGAAVPHGGFSAGADVIKVNVRPRIEPR